MRISQIDLDNKVTEYLMNRSLKNSKSNINKTPLITGRTI